MTDRTIYKLSEQERMERLDYLGLTADDYEVLREVHPLFVNRRDEFLDRFYDQLMRFDGSRAKFSSPQVMERARVAQAAYFERLLLGNYDEAFFEQSIRIGLRHQELGIEPRWVVGAWTMYLNFFMELVVATYPPESPKKLQVMQALNKVIMLAIQLNVEAYYSRTLDRVQAIVASQREAILELSTPVIEIWKGIMVLPLIGTIDSMRTRQIMDNLLNRVVETQAEYVILDLTGVSVVDTAVANHLMKTVDAAELLGTHCIVTGISPAIAQTLVHLGVDLGHITTCSNLRTGLQLALRSQGIQMVQATEEP